MKNTIIECYLQLEKYYSDPNCSIPDHEAWALEIYNDLKTDLGKEIFDSLKHEDDDFLGWSLQNGVNPKDVVGN